jgi:PAS domain S-box-containing protein
VNDTEGKRVVATRAEGEFLPHHRDPFRLLIESVQDYAIFLLDTDGRIISWNAGAQRIKGYAASEIVGKHFSNLYTAEDAKSGKPERELDVASRDGRFEEEGWRRRKDGSLFWANVIITALRDPSGRLYGFGKVTRDFTERMRFVQDLQRAKAATEMEVVERTAAERRLRESERSLRELSARLVQAQEEERRRLGRDLHDSVGQYLAMLKLSLDLLDRESQGIEGQSRRHITECLQLVEDAIKEVRTLSYLLYPPMLEEAGLSVAIQWYLDGFSKRSGIETAVQMSVPVQRLPREVESTVFRVLQEALTNVHRHSNSPVARVNVSVDKGVVHLEVHDDGIGMRGDGSGSLMDAVGTRGVGLRGMAELVRQLEGTLTLSSEPGKGTVVRASIPFAEEKHSGGSR